ncbi:PREDICTED: serine protease 33-like [Nanorana parkeri]|uniref:serine protease 33-like n=1 Tax=Nanorana parkeri TaxID=125878 RepID=UPI00085402DE|nr:PREDICTED: serine protease 33-like [Nanorana parkeri]
MTRVRCVIRNDQRWLLAEYLGLSRLIQIILVAIMITLCGASCLYNEDEEPPPSPSSLGDGFFSVTNSTLTVHLGCYQLSSPNSQEISVGVKNIIRNPKFTDVGSLGDISLIELKTPVNYTAYILPVCLPTADVNFTMGLQCWVTGWGSIRSGVSLPSPQTLQEAQIPLIDIKTCDSLYHIQSDVSSSVPIILSDMICGGYQAGGTDSCQGDSGGPLVCSQGGQWFLAGLVSWGDGCGKVNRPGVYTRLTSFQNWIKQNAPGTEKNMVDVVFNVTVNRDAYLNLSSTATPISSKMWPIVLSAVLYVWML